MHKWQFKKSFIYTWYSFVRLSYIVYLVQFPFSLALLYLWMLPIYHLCHSFHFVHATSVYLLSNICDASFHIRQSHQAANLTNEEQRKTWQPPIAKRKATVGGITQLDRQRTVDSCLLWQHYEKAVWCIVH